MLEAKLDDFRFPIHHLRADVARLEREVSGSRNIGLAVIDYFYCYVACGDVEQNIRGMRSAIAALEEFAEKSDLPVVGPCPLPCRNGSSVIARAITTLRTVPDLHTVFLVNGTNSGTMTLAKGSTGANAGAFGFRLRRRPAPWEGFAPTIVWENSVPQSAVKHESHTFELLSNREMPNISDPDVSDERSSPSVVPAQARELSPTPTAPSTRPEMASANAIEGAAATRGTVLQSLRPGASANVGKLALGLTRPLGRKLTVPVTPFYSKPVAGTPAPFSSIAAEEADEKRRRRAKPAFGGKRSVGRGQGGSTKASAKPRKLGKRIQQKKRKRVSRYLSDWE